ncbi:hypothetical protein GCM10009860_25410 [Microbacterium mitrae]|uniref:hypothetical protein n=1 Tax=Microbacterium mitrae TaxID=664640 RepID=UPI0011C8EFAD|nr:hypothetical protein [Microbacterium mitrae]
MTTASVSIPAGWYSVAGTNDVRWWDGRGFREVTLVDGAPRYRFAWGLPAGNYLLGAVIVLVFGVVSLFVGDSLRGGGWLVLLVAALIAVGFGVVGVLAMKTLRLPPPTGEPVRADAVQPLPGAAEPGPIAPGWYAGPARDKPRWWTGAQWTDYLVYAGVPYPARGQDERVRRQSRRVALGAAGIFVASVVGAVIAGVSGAVGVAIVLSAIAVIALAVAIGLRLGERRAMRPFIRPLLPPAGPPIA